MCCYPCQKMKNQFLMDLAGEESFIAFKDLVISTIDVLPRVRTALKGVPVHIGWNSVELPENFVYDADFPKGLHVYLNAHDIRRNERTSRQVYTVPVRVYTTDLIVIGQGNEYLAGHPNTAMPQAQAVVRRYYLSAKDLRAAGLLQLMQ